MDRKSHQLRTETTNTNTMKHNYTDTQLQAASLSQLRPITEAGAVPEGCVRYYIYKKDGEWTTATKHRAMQDTHFVDIRLPYLDPEYKPSTEPLEIKPWTPAVGDVVTLKSGGPKMTVNAKESAIIWDVVWISTDGFIRFASFPTACLQPA